MFFMGLTPLLFSFSYVNMIHSSYSRFIVFLDNHGIVSEKRITPEVIKDFQVQDNHSTVEGKNA